MKIYTSKNIMELKDVPIIENEYEYYIYVMLNSPANNIKIGKTTNIIQRLQSLSGSNGGGNKIIKLYLSPATYVKSMEHALHEHYYNYRIQGTEWFSGKELDFEEVSAYIDSLFETKGYKKCNEIRKELAEKEIIKAEEKKKLEEEKEKQLLKQEVTSSTKKKASKRKKST